MFVCSLVIDILYYYVSDICMSETILAQLAHKLNQSHINHQQWHHRIEEINHSRSKIQNQLSSLAKDYEYKVKRLQEQLAASVSQNEKLIKQNRKYKKNIDEYRGMLMEKDAFIEKLLKQMNSYGDIAVDWNGKKEENVLGAIEEKGTIEEKRVTEEKGFEETSDLHRQSTSKKDDQKKDAENQHQEMKASEEISPTAKTTNNNRIPEQQQSNQQLEKPKKRIAAPPPKKPNKINKGIKKISEEAFHEDSSAFQNNEQSNIDQIETNQINESKGQPNIPRRKPVNSRIPPPPPKKVPVIVQPKQQPQQQQNFNEEPDNRQQQQQLQEDDLNYQQIPQPEDQQPQYQQQQAQQHYEQNQQEDERPQSPQQPDFLSHFRKDQHRQDQPQASFKKQQEPPQSKQSPYYFEAPSSEDFFSNLSAGNPQTPNYGNNMIEVQESSIDFAEQQQSVSESIANMWDNRDSRYKQSISNQQEQQSKQITNTRAPPPPKKMTKKKQKATIKTLDPNSFA